MRKPAATISINARLSRELGERFYREVEAHHLKIGEAFSQAVETWLNMREIAHDYKRPIENEGQAGE